jgi:hypothetical protein
VCILVLLSEAFQVSLLEYPHFIHGIKPTSAPIVCQLRSHSEYLEPLHSQDFKLKSQAAHTARLLEQLRMLNWVGKKSQA